MTAHRGAGLRAVVWKEWRELLLPGGRPSGMFLGGLAAAVLVAAFGIYFVSLIHDDAAEASAEDARVAEAITAPAGLGFAAALSVFTVTGLVPESFAGERERHTLEALLATRLDARDILFGKMLAIGGYGLGLSVLAMLIYTIGLAFVTTSTIAVGATVLLMFGMIAADVIALLFLLSLGVLVSLRARTVRSAQQTMVFLMLPVFMGPGVFFSLGGSFAESATEEQVARILLTVTIAAGAAVLLLTVLFLALVLRAFERERLVLR